MRYGLKSVLALSCLTFAMQFTSSNAFAGSTPSFSCGTKKLSPAQCVVVRKLLADYIVIVKKILGNSTLANALIARAQQDTNKVCPLPPPPPGNGWTPDTQNECTVLAPSMTSATQVGLDANGALTNIAPAAKTVCMSENACLTIASQAYTLFSISETTRCSDPNDTTVQHLSDAQLQTKVNELLGQ